MRSLTQAIHDKFDDDDEDVSSSELVMFLHVPKTSRRQRLPSVLVLDHCDIDSVGDEESLSSTCSDVRELDLSDNQISGWDEVVKLINCLPKLSFLNLTNNILGGAPVDPPLCTNLFPSITTLILNRVGLEWDNLVLYLSLIPNLEELHLSFNEMKIPVERTEILFPKVTTLHYDGNCVEHRDHLSWISQNFPSLKSLVLCDCPLWTLRWNSSTQRKTWGIRSIESSSECHNEGSESSSHCFGDGKSDCCYCLPDDHSTPDVLFPNLHSISLNNCIINCWEELDHLRQFPSLLELRLQSCPLFQKLTEHERRQFIIARLPNVRRLNGGAEITGKEREDAERSFIRRYHDRQTKSTRYGELLERHGHLEPLAEVNLTPQRFIAITVRFGEQRWKVKKLSIYTTAKKLRERLGSKVGSPSSKVQLFHFTGNQNFLLCYPSKALHSYNIQDGDELIMNIKS